MKRVFILLFSLLITHLVSAQDYCEMDRFDNLIFDSTDVEVVTNIIYGEGINNLNNNQKLYLDIYYPKLAIDPLAKKPFIMFVHGGGLVGGDKDSEGAVELGYLFARAGYVFASVDYRIGWDSGEEGSSCNGDTIDLFRASYRAIQDVRAAFRFLKSNADAYGIDTNYMILEGNSAGSRLIMFATYAQQSDFYPQFYDELGSIDTAINDIGNYNYNPIALITEAGGIETPEILMRKDIPSMFFHGTCDSIVPYFSGPTFTCYDPIQYPKLFGSWSITQMFNDAGRKYHFYTGEGAGHDVAPSDTIFNYSKSFLKEILCNNFTKKEIYRVIGKFKCAVENNGELYVVNLFPNPATDYLYLNVTGSRIRDIDLNIYNAIGQVVKSNLLDFYPPIRDYTIDVSALSHGIYYLRISQRQEVYVVKFVK